MAYWFKCTHSHEQAHFSYVYGTIKDFLINMFISLLDLLTYLKDVHYLHMECNTSKKLPFPYI